MTKKIILLFILIAITGCLKPEVNYDEMFEPPSVKITSNQIMIKSGSSNRASSSYVIPHAKIKDNKIYIYGTLSLMSFSNENDTEITLKLPDNKNPWEIYWVNRDGSLIKIINVL